jgi:tRNA pseudouridine38-40 synthase
MVRNVVGALLHVGAGKGDAAWMTELLHARDRREAPPTISSDGLYFTGADYDPAFGLPATRRDVVFAY